jgi:hypothetical protein
MLGKENRQELRDDHSERRELNPPLLGQTIWNVRGSEHRWSHSLETLKVFCRSKIVFGRPQNPLRTEFLSANCSRLGSFAR